MCLARHVGVAEFPYWRGAIRPFFAAVLVFLICASEVAGGTIYKYRTVDGRTVHSDRPLAEGVLLEKFDYQIPTASPAQNESARKRRLEAEERIRSRLRALDEAWQELQDAHVALATAEERLRLEVEPVEGEPTQIVGPGVLAPPSVGGPQHPARPAVGGPQAPASPAVGGPLGKRHGGGGRSPDYVARMEALEANVEAARAKVEAAQQRYNSLH